MAARSDSTIESDLAATDPMESRRHFAVSTEKNLGREDSTILVSRAYMRGPWYLPKFGPIHHKAGKPKRDTTSSAGGEVSLKYL